MPQPETIEIVVVKTPKGYIVRPAYVIARKGDVLVWINLTGKDPEKPDLAKEGITVNIPCGALGTPTAVETRVQTTIPTTAPYGFHTYSVYSKRKGGYCKGESTPGIIIKG